MGKVRETDKVAVIGELRQKYKLAALLKLAELLRSTYYYYVNRAKNRINMQRSKMRFQGSIMKIRGVTGIGESRWN